MMTMFLRQIPLANSQQGCGDFMFLCFRNVFKKGENIDLRQRNHSDLCVYVFVSRART